eukprot:scaffold14068_cov119-Isochrysis_galbana.AAC.14
MPQLEILPDTVPLGLGRERCDPAIGAPPPPGKALVVATSARQDILEPIELPGAALPPLHADPNLGVSPTVQDFDQLALPDGKDVLHLLGLHARLPARAQQIVAEECRVLLVDKLGSRGVDKGPTRAQHQTAWRDLARLRAQTVRRAGTMRGRNMRWPS